MKIKKYKTCSNAFAAIAFGLVVLALAFPSITLGQVTKRPLSDFLDAQGKSGSSFFPPFPDYVGWVDDAFQTFALIDYAGVLAFPPVDDDTGEPLYDYDPIDIPTRFVGSITERTNSDGTAEIKVILQTKNALGFAQSIPDLGPNFDFAGTPTIFGQKAVDVAIGEDAATGVVALNVTFTINAPGDPLPDFFDIVFDDNDPNSYAPAAFDLHATIIGTRYDDENPGSKATLRVHQIASIAAEDGADWIYSKEYVEILGKPLKE